MRQFLVLLPFTVSGRSGPEARDQLITDLRTLMESRLTAHMHEESAQVFDAGPCCSGINGSHTARCEANKDRLTCWCCGGTFPSMWACLWSDKGSRCFACESHVDACRLFVGRPLEEEQ